MPEVTYYADAVPDREVGWKIFLCSVVKDEGGGVPPELGKIEEWSAQEADGLLSEAGFGHPKDGGWEDFLSDEVWFVGEEVLVTDTYRDENLLLGYEEIPKEFRAWVALNTSPQGEIVPGPPPPEGLSEWIEGVRKAHPRFRRTAYLTQLGEGAS